MKPTWDTPFRPQQVQRVTLEKCRIAVQKALPKHAIGCELDIQVQEDFIIEALVFKLVATLTGKKHLLDQQTVTVSVEIAADWWQAVRQRWAPVWWLMRWPVKMRTVSKSETWTRAVTKMCPHLAVPGNRPHVEFLMDPTSLWPENPG